MTHSNDAAGGREWNPYEMATPVTAAPGGDALPPLAQTPIAGSPYATPRAPLRAQVLDEMNGLASPGRRLLAFLVDAGIGFVPLIVLVPELVKMMFMGPLERLMYTPGNAFGVRVGIASIVLVVLVIWNIVLLVQHSQTVGKRFIGIRIVRSDGSRAGFWRIVLLRSLVMGLIMGAVGAVIPFGNHALWLVDSLLVFSLGNRTLHDRIADTMVVDA